MAAGLLLAIVATAFPSSAETSAEDRALAQTLFEEGRKLMKDGKPAEACPKFEASQKIDPAPGTLLNLGVCHAQTGKTATAWIELNESIARAKKDGRNDRLQIAQDELAKLEPKLSKLVVVVDAANAPPDLAVTLDGKPLAAGAWGVEFNVDPGPHGVSASAAGKQTWSTTVDVGLVADRKRVEVPALAANTNATGGETVVDVRSPNRTWAYVIGGFGIVATGVGTYFAIHAHSLRNDADAAFAANDPSAPDKGDQTRTAITFARVGLGVGLVSLAASAVLFVSAKPSEPRPAPSTAIRVVPDFGYASAGLSLSGGW
jgi:hypothetical protein